MVVEERPLVPILGQTGPVARSFENADFQSIFARSASAVTSSEKSSVNTNRKSTTRFPMSLRRTAYGRFPSKIALLSNTVLCVKTVGDKVVRHSLACLSVQK